MAHTNTPRGVQKTHLEGNTTQGAMSHEALTRIVPSFVRLLPFYSVSLEHGINNLMVAYK
jgi:hypothetical protein